MTRSARAPREAPPRRSLFNWISFFAGFIALPAVAIWIGLRAIMTPQAVVRPPTLWLEKLGNSCAGRSILLRVRNESSERIDIPQTMGSAKFMVDGSVHKARAPMFKWAGNPFLEPDREYEWQIDPKEDFNSDLGARAHVVSVEFGERWSPKLSLKCSSPYP